MVALPLQALEQEIKDEAHRLGFELVDITTAEPAETGPQYADWVASGHAGEMGYMTREPARRQHPAAVMSGARSVVVVGMLYAPPDAAEGDEGTSPPSP